MASAERLFSITVSVQLPPVPAMTGTRPFTRSTTNWMTESFSSRLSVDDSPVVPQTTIASVPLAICSSISRVKAVKSTAPLWNGVMIATALP